MSADDLANGRRYVGTAAVPCTRGTGQSGIGDPADVLDAIETDRFFEVPSLQLAAAGELGADVSPYGSPGGRRRWSPAGSGPATCSRSPSSSTASTPRSPDASSGPTTPRSLADATHHAWVAFATDGVPGGRAAAVAAVRRGVEAGDAAGRTERRRDQRRRPAPDVALRGRPSLKERASGGPPCCSPSPACSRSRRSPTRRRGRTRSSSR